MAQQFLAWAVQTGTQWSDAASLDLAVVQFMTSMHEDGEPAHYGSAVVAAMQHFSLGARLPRAARALAGWSKLQPATQRLPLPRVVAAAIAGTMVSHGEPMMALMVLLSFVCYLRPHEALALRTECVVAPRPGAGSQYQAWGLILNDASTGRPGKTGMLDESVLIDLDCYLWPVLQAAVLARPSPGPLWPFAAHQFRKEWTRCCSQLHLQALAPQPHGLRHGGASDDLLTKRRGAAEVKSRGRWSCDQSLRRYGKATRLQAELRKVAPSVVQFGRAVEESFGPLLCHFHTTGVMLMPVPPLASLAGFW